MRVHPGPPAPPLRKRGVAAAAGRQKRLRRLPHVFHKVLELPFSADADVAVLESPRCFHFVVAADAVDADATVSTRVVRIHPGVIKVVVIIGGDEIDGLDLDTWRFRLPPCARAARAEAIWNSNGELVVTVPKSEGEEEEEDDDDGRLVDGAMRGC